MSWDYEGTKADTIIARVVNEQETTLDDVLTAAKLAARNFHDSLGLVARTSAILVQKLQDAADEDGTLDQKVEGAASAFIGAGFTTRKKPFGTYSSYSPSRMVELKMAREVQEVQALIANVAEANPPEPVIKAIADLLRQSSLVRTRLDDLTQPQDDADKAIRARTDAALELKRVMRKLRLRAELAWPNDEKKLKRLFALPEVVQDSVRRKRKSGEAEKAVTPAAPTPG